MNGLTDGDRRAILRVGRLFERVARTTQDLKVQGAALDGMRHLFVLLFLQEDGR